MLSKERPYVLYVAEVIYSKVCEIKKKKILISLILLPLKTLLDLRYIKK